LLDRYNVRWALLHPIIEFLTLRADGEAGEAMMAALNDWMVDQWLDREERCRGGISVPYEDARRSAREIERRASDPRWAKVMLPGRTREGLGDPKYRPIFEAAVQHGLPIGIHVGGFSGAGPGPGWPSLFLEYQVAYHLDIQAQIASLVCSGIFEELPDLRIMLEETGIGWLAPFIWRFDRVWDDMKEERPALQMRPSETIRKHFWITTQPIDAPAEVRDFQSMIRHMQMDDHIVFSTDYPHWNFDDPRRVITPARFGAELQRRVLFDNAASLFFPSEEGI
jgi:predicted TIM-barrel fold metal-dependent hydrolase